MRCKKPLRPLTQRGGGGIELQRRKMEATKTRAVAGEGSDGLEIRIPLRPAIVLVPLVIQFERL